MPMSKQVCVSTFEHICDSTPVFLQDFMVGHVEVGVVYRMHVHVDAHGPGDCTCMFVQLWLR